MRFKPLDYISAAYFLVVSVLILVGHANITQWPQRVLWYLSLVGVIVLLVFLEYRFPTNRWIKFFRLAYPLLAVLFLYKGIEGYVLIIYGRFLDQEIVQFEKWLLGVNPTLALERIVSRPLTEYFKFVYFSYYLYVAGPPLFLFFLRRDADMERFVFTTALTFYVSFLGFALLPLEGPRYFFEGAYVIPQLTGYVFTPLQDFIMARGAARGACFPSSHLAVAWVSLFLIRKFFGRTPFWIIFPLTVSMTVAIVYNRYHYVSDAVAGILTGWLCYQLAKGMYRRLPRPVSALKP